MSQEAIRFPSLRFPPGLDPEAFLKRYWQRTPLLIRQGLPGFRNPLPADELAGLACEPDVESRIVQERGADGPWQVLHGPFDAASFAALPQSHWTLLVQDVDKHIPEIGSLLDRFPFLPKWRIDDIMVSYAEDQGSVGPHADEYDVFLIQAEGRRRWRIATGREPPRELVPDLEIKILQHFEADQEWLLEPGDILYLPPGVPHWGIAEGPCQTWSVGLRAPSWRELADDWLAYVAERFSPPGRWRDAGTSPPTDSAELDADTLAEMRRQIEAGLKAAGSDDFQRWLGALLTEPKMGLELVPPEPPWPQDRVLATLRVKGRLDRDGRSRLLYAKPAAPGGPARLFANGQVHEVAPALLGLASLIANRRSLDYSEAQPWLKRPEAAGLLVTLFNTGHFADPSDG